MKPFLLLQIRPLDQASNDEYEAFLKYTGLNKKDVRRIRLEQNGLPPLNLDDYSGIILGGGPSNISDQPEQKSEEQLRFESDLSNLLDEVFESDHPFLGVCYGMGFLSQHQGGEVSTERFGESVGAINIQKTRQGETDKLLEGLPNEFMAYCGHKEACQNLPPGAVLLASSEECPSQMIRFRSNIYATQFHVELDEKGINLRIDVYKNYGYFDPEDAEILKNKLADTLVTHPSDILRRFVEIYKR